MHLPITSLFASISALIYLKLTLQVVRLRKQNQIAIGNGGNPELSAAINSHSNFSQYIPISLIMVGLCEVQGIPKALLALITGCIIIGRVIHIRAITDANLVHPIRLRGIGMRLTLFPMLFLAILLALVPILSQFGVY
jgi:uncharacterized membrane protein YecN with MAPEG domain